MQKIKRYRSADCVIGGFRYGENLQAGRKVVGSVLLGLYDADGMLHHVGFSSGIKAKDKPALTDKLEALKHIEVSQEMLQAAPADGQQNGRRNGSR